MNMNRLIKDLKNGNNPEENLGAYSQWMFSSYERLALGRFALDFTEKYDLLAKDEDGIARKVLGTVTQITRDLTSSKTGAFTGDLAKLDEVRTKVIQTMDTMEEYLHYFQLYEHIFNRLSYKFEESLSVIDVREMTEKVMAYITQKQDAGMVNERIQAVFGELPLRLTTSKFFELLEKSCLCYTGARNDMAEAFFARMERCASLPVLDRLNRSESQLYAIAAQFKGAEPAEATKDECRDFTAKLAVAATMVAKELGNGLDLLDMINDLYILLIVQPYKVHPSPEWDRLCGILSAYLKAVDSGDFLDIDEDILGGLSKTVEGEQKYMGEHMMMEDALEEIYEKNKRCIDGMMLGGVFTALRTAQRLFMPGSRVDVTELATYATVGQETVADMIRRLEEVYDRSFKSCGQLMKRSLIAMAFDQMPVAFDRLEDVRDSIRQSLEGCTQQYELAAVENILTDMMNAKVV